MNSLIPTNTIEQIVAYRDGALAALDEAYNLFEIARQKMHE